MNYLSWLLLNFSLKLFSFVVYRFPFFGKYLMMTYYSDYEKNAKDLLLQKEARYSVEEKNIKLLPVIKANYHPPGYARISETKNIYLNKTGPAIILEREGAIITSKGISTRQFIYDSEKKTITFSFIISKLLSKKNKIKINKCLLLHERYSNLNYYHWIVEALPKYILYLDLNKQFKIENLPLVLPKTAPAYIKDSIYLLNPDQEIIWIAEDELLKTEKVFWIDNFVKSGFIHPLLVQNLRDALLQKIKISLPNDVIDYQGVYVARKTNGRKIINEDELFPIFREFKIKIIDFESSTISQQIEVMSQAKILIGTHGANLTNGIFMPPNSTVIEITTPDRLKEPNFRFCFYAVFGCLNYTYIPVIGDSQKPNDLNADIYLTPELLRTALESIN